ncbi:MAG: HAD-IA family hydrolase [Chloroflexota bacterium]
MTLKAIVLGSIGVIVETSEIQRAAYNQAFAEAGLDWTWEQAPYQQMLGINGGKRRLRHFAEQTNTDLTEELIDHLHARKSQIFQAYIRDNGLTPRPGIAELVDAAIEAGIAVATAETTSRANIDAIDAALGEASVYPKLTLRTDGTFVVEKKPHREIYQVVMAKLGVAPHEVIAIEDSASSLDSAVDANVLSVAYPGANTAHENYSKAVAVATPEQIADLDWLRERLTERHPA